MQFYQELSDDRKCKLQQQFLNFQRQMQARLNFAPISVAEMADNLDFRGFDGEQIRAHSARQFQPCFAPIEENAIVGGVGISDVAGDDGQKHIGARRHNSLSKLRWPDGV